VSALIGAVIAASVFGGFWKRVFIVTIIGVAACSGVSAIYWNWYGFPTEFFIAQIVDMVIGFFLVGLVVCKMVGIFTAPA
jgi:hypothetical protein